MNTQDLIKIEDDYFINTFTRQPVILDHGEGVKVTDIDGNEYLDMFAGIAVNCLGHNHPKLVSAIQNQASKLIHISSIYYNEPALTYAKKLVDKNPPLRADFFLPYGARPLILKLAAARIKITVSRLTARNRGSRRR